VKFVRSKKALNFEKSNEKRFFYTEKNFYDFAVNILFISQLPFCGRCVFLPRGEKFTGF